MTTAAVAHNDVSTALVFPDQTNTVSFQNEVSAQVVPRTTQAVCAAVVFFVANPRANDLLKSIHYCIECMLKTLCAIHCGKNLEELEVSKNGFKLIPCLLSRHA